MLFSPADGIGTWTITELISPALFYGSLGVSFLVRFSRRLPIVVTTQPPPPTPPTPPLLRLLFLLTGPLHLSHLGVGLKAAGILKSTFLQPPFHSSLSLSLSISRIFWHFRALFAHPSLSLSLSLSLYSSFLIVYDLNSGSDRYDVIRAPPEVSLQWPSRPSRPDAESDCLLILVYRWIGGRRWRISVGKW